MTKGGRADPDTKLSWWERLILERPRNDFTECPSSKTLNDSIDVVCSKCSTILIGIQQSNIAKSLVIKFLQGAAVVVALAVGYLNWTWPIFAFSSILVIMFFSLFLRHHKNTRNFFFVVSAFSFIGYGVWKTLNPENPSFLQVIGLLLTVMLVLELMFLVQLTLSTSRNDFRKYWLPSNNIDLGSYTLTWISLMLTITFLCILAVVANLITPTFIQMFIQNNNFNYFALRGAIQAFSATQVAVLISSTVYSLKGHPFSVLDRWTYKPILCKCNFGRVQVAQHLDVIKWTLRLIHSIKRFAIAASNRIIQGIENAYNYFIVSFLNNLVRVAIKITNTIRCMIIKTIRHIIRSLMRFILLNRWCIKWAWHVGVQYAKVFILPLVLFIVGTMLLYSISDDFFSYVHDGSAFLPIIIAVKSLALIILFTIGTGFLSHANLLVFFDKTLNALSIFGASAFLFFVLLAWLLGIIGMLTSGPYRIGWVTILSTLAMISVFFISKRRPSTSPNSEFDG